MYGHLASRPERQKRRKKTSEMVRFLYDRVRFDMFYVETLARNVSRLQERNLMELREGGAARGGGGAGGRLKGRDHDRWLKNGL
jgi:hypothetical protein